MIFFAVGAEETHAQADVQRQTPSGMPIVLKVGFKYLVLLVHFERGAFLCVAADIAEEKIGKSISGGNEACIAIGHETVHSISRLRNLVFVRVDVVGAELQVVSTDDLRHIVAEGRRRIGIQRPIGNVSRIFGASAAILSATDADPRHLSAKTVVVKPDYRKSRRTLPGTS